MHFRSQLLDESWQEERKRNGLRVVFVLMKVVVKIISIYSVEVQEENPGGQPGNLELSGNFGHME